MPCINEPTVSATLVKIFIVVATPACKCKTILDLKILVNNQLITYYLRVSYLLRKQEYPVNNTYNKMTEVISTISGFKLSLLFYNSCLKNPRVVFLSWLAGHENCHSYLNFKFSFGNIFDSFPSNRY